MKTDQDILRARSTVLEQADVFSFDSVFGGNVSQQVFYNFVCAGRI
jgi:hypothetical protein